MRRSKLFVKRLHKDALLPVMGSDMAAGYDIHALHDANIPSKGMAVIETGLAFVIPKGNYGRIASRSGLAVRHRLDVGAGVVDADYRGAIKIVMFNFNNRAFKVRARDRIAQLIIEKYTPTEIVEVDGELDQTARGLKGFGSTGIKSLEPSQEIKK